MDVAAIHFSGDSFGKLQDMGASNAKRITASKTVSLELLERFRAVRVIEKRGEGVVRDYLVPLEVLQMVELVREEGKAAVIPERNGQAQQQARK